MLEVIFIMGAMIAALLVVRLTEKPIRVHFNLSESAANTFTTIPINLPSVGTVNLSRGKRTAIGVEIMKVKTTLLTADQEPGQQNRVQYELVKGAAPTAPLGVFNGLTIWERDRRSLSEDATSVNHQITQENSFWDDLTDGDGNGEIVSDAEIHASVLGTGNAATKQIRGYMLLHLVELDSDEALFEMIEQAS